MPGCIMGCYGYQRSGKTLFAYITAESFKNRYDIPVFSNMHVDGWTTISALSDVPQDKKPKVLVLDEVYFFMDSRTWQQNTQSSIFFNTLGKQNIFLIMTAIDPAEVEIRLRKQHNYMVMCKSNEDYIYCRILDVQRNIKNDIAIKKDPKLFEKLKYDTHQTPDCIDCNVGDFIKNNQNRRSVNKWI